eukprot:scaffold63929_cov65-Phaeocystis_antarctica.AAC.3
MGASGARSACASPIFVRCASPPGTARATLRALPVMSRTGPTRFDAWSSRGGRPERTLGEHPHVLGRHVVCRKGLNLVPFIPPPARACTAGATSAGKGGTSYPSSSKI